MSDVSEDLTFITMEPSPSGALIKVVGIGGGGGNNARYIHEKDTQNIRCYSINTDEQALADMQNRCTRCLQIGSKTTQGLGTGADPEKGYKSAMEDKARIASLVVANADIVFLMAGMGGGTGTGASPVVAEVARKMGILTVGIVTMPFKNENRTQTAIAGVNKLVECVDALIVLFNDNLSDSPEGPTSLQNSFARTNEAVYDTVSSITDLITRPRYINVDFADIRAVLQSAGHTFVGTGVAKGPRRVASALKQAASNPLTDNVCRQAQRLLINISTSCKGALSLDEYQRISACVSKKYAAQGAKIIIGTASDNSLNDRIKITMVATASHQPDAEVVPDYVGVNRPEREPVETGQPDSTYQ